MEEWKSYKLSDVTDSIGDGIHGTPKYDEDGSYFFINGNNLENGKIIIRSSTKRVSEEEALKHRKRISERTILVSINGTLGNTARYNYERCILGKSACYLNVKEDVDIDFIYYVVTNKQFKDTISRLATGTTIKNVSLETMRNYEFFMPSLENQKKISSILKSIDDKIAINCQINDNLEQQAQALYKSWFVDFEPFKDGKFIDSELGIIPEGWKILPLSSLGSIICGKTPSKSNKDFYDGNIPFIKIPDMHNKIFVSNSEDHLSDLGMNSQRNKTIPPYSILVSCIATVGLVCINTKVCQTNQQINTLIPYEDSYRIYLFLFLKSLREQLITLGSGGTTTLNVNTSQFSNLKIIVPDTKSLKAFSSIAESLFQRINNNCDTNYMLSNLRDMILPKLMSGELKINDLDC